MRKRNHIIPLHLNKKELAHLEAQVKTSGLPREEFLRTLIMGAELRARPCDHHADLLHKVAGLCNNANQLAKVANTYGEASQQDIEGNDEAGPAGLGRSKGELVANLRLDAIRAHNQDVNQPKLPAPKKGENRYCLHQHYPRPPPRQRHRLYP